jgi:predicted TIM-barrel fold metal-dependent hydrolase
MTTTAHDPTGELVGHELTSADSHILVLDEHVLAHLPPGVHESYLGIRGAHRDPNASVADPGPRPAGEWDPVARLGDMDLDGVTIEVLYIDPTGGAAFYQLDDEPGRAAVTAFNSAALDFTLTDPSRLVAVHLLPLHGIDVSAEHAIAELHRLVDHGAKAIQVPLYPEDARLPPYWNACYDPLWSAIEETGTPISLHVCPPKGRGLGADPTPARGIFQVMPPILMSQPLVEWILTGIFQRHPRLRVVLVEAGLGWIPYLLDRLDLCHQKGDWKAKGMPIEHLPSDYWAQNMAATFEEDPVGLSMRHRLGVDNLLWATDYPHPDMTFPRSREVIATEFGDCTPAEVAQLTGANARRIYHL